MFAVGDRVEKYKGGYRAFGQVRAVGDTKAGKTFYVVEYDMPAGLLHIHSDSDLRGPLAQLDRAQDYES